MMQKPVLVVKESAVSRQEESGAKRNARGEGNQKHDHSLVLGGDVRRSATQDLTCHHARDGDQADDVHRVERRR